MTLGAAFFMRCVTALEGRLADEADCRDLQRISDLIAWEKARDRKRCDNMSSYDLGGGRRED
jgi:hypothetical protein